MNFNKSNRSIASNSMLLFVRIFIVTIVNLYAVRLVLEGLGVVDYGIFNAVAGVITTMACLSTVLASSTQRFYSYAMGQDGNKTLSLRNIFSASMVINVSFSIIALLLAETLGLWFLNTQLTIPALRMDAAIWAYHFALITFICSLVQIPYLSATIAHEEMGIFAIVSTLECLLKLLVAYLIIVSSADKLVFYCAGLCVVSVCVLLSYAITGRLKYDECRYKRVGDRMVYKQLLSFSGWTLFGSLANVGMIQGGILLLNIFFGPVVNAAFAISLQINNAFNSLSGSVVLAFKPAIIKAYSEKNHGYLNGLFNMGNKFLFYVLLLVALPIFFEMETILKLWLGFADATTLLFSRMIVIYSILLALNNPITTIIQATGHVKEYHLQVESVTLLCLPLALLLFYLDCPAYCMLLSMLAVCLVAHLIRLACLKKYYSLYRLSDYFRRFVLPAAIVVLLMTAVSVLLMENIENITLRFAMFFTVEPLFMAIVVFMIGIDHRERQLAKALVMSYINRKK